MECAVVVAPSLTPDELPFAQSKVR